MARQWGAGDYRYDLVENWPKVAVKSSQERMAHLNE